MIKENQRILNSLLVVIDVLVILFSLVLAYYVRFKTTLFGPLGGSLPFLDYFLFTVFAIIPTYLLLYYFFGLYKPFRNKPSILSGAEDIIKADIMAFIILIGPIGDMLGSKTLLIFKKDRWLLICSIITAISNIVLNALFIPRWGVPGAAAATLVSALISTVSRYYFTNRFLEVKLLNSTLFKYFAFAEYASGMQTKISEKSVSQIINREQIKQNAKTISQKSAERSKEKHLSKSGISGR